MSVWLQNESCGWVISHTWHGSWVWRNSTMWYVSGMTLKRIQVICEWVNVCIHVIRVIWLIHMIPCDTCAITHPYERIQVICEWVNLWMNHMDELFHTYHMDERNSFMWYMSNDSFIWLWNSSCDARMSQRMNEAYGWVNVWINHMNYLTFTTSDIPNSSMWYVNESFRRYEWAYHISLLNESYGWVIQKWYVDHFVGICDTLIYTYEMIRMTHSEVICDTFHTHDMDEFLGVM